MNKKNTKKGWDKDDEVILNSIIKYVDYFGELSNYPDNRDIAIYIDIQNKIKWLKGIKDRITKK